MGPEEHRPPDGRVHRRSGDGWVDCSCGDEHWGLNGAAGLLVWRREAGRVRRHAVAAIAGPGLLDEGNGVRAEDAEMGNQAAEAAGLKGAAGKTEDVNLVAGRVVEDQEAVGLPDVVQQAGAEGKVTMLSDGNGELAQAMGLTMDGSKFGMGTRGQRWSAIVDDNVVTSLNVEEPGAFSVSSADHLISQL